MNQATLKKYLSLLPATIPQIMETLCCGPDTAYKWVNRLRDLEMAHIGGWHKGEKGPLAPLHVAGPGVDVVRPSQPPTSSKNMARWRRMHRQTTGEDTVAYAVRTQPNSIFNMSAFG